MKLDHFSTRPTKMKKKMSRKKDMERKKMMRKPEKKTSIPPQIFQCIRHRGLSIDPSQFDNFRLPFLY